MSHTTQATHRVTVYTCPACNKNVQATLVVDFNSIKWEREDDRHITMEGKVVGARVDSHDCVPKVQRHSLGGATDPDSITNSR